MRALGRVAVEAEADAGDGRRQIRELSAVERQALDRPRIDDPADRRGGGLDQRRRAGHVHRLRDRGGLEREVDRLRLGDVHLDVLLRYRREAREVRRDVVDADRERREAIHALSVARLGPRKSGRRALGGDGRAGNGGALLVDDTPRDRTGGLLRERRRAGEQQKCDCSKKVSDHPTPPDVQRTTVSD